MTAASPNEPGSASVAPAEKRRPGPRFRELDGLRGIAALAVVFSHFGGGFDDLYPDAPHAFYRFDWGGLGVQLFFIISGFVIFMTARRARRPSDFAISRAARLYPPYWISLVFSSLLILLFPVPGHGVTLIQFIANLTMVQRWFMVDGVVGVYWTLAVEMQFYAIIFALLLLTRCRLSERVVLWGCMAWSVISWAVVLVVAPASAPVAQDDPRWVKLLTNITVAEYAPLFVLGMALFLARETGRHHSWVVLAIASAAGNAFVLRGLLSGVQVSAVCAVAAFVMLRSRTRLLLAPSVQWYGKISYSLYIIHAVPGFILIHHLWPIVGRNVAMVIALAVVSVVSWAVWKYGEQSLGREAKRGLVRLRARVDSVRARPSSGPHIEGVGA